MQTGSAGLRCRPFTVLRLRPRRGSRSSAALQVRATTPSFNDLPNIEELNRGVTEQAASSSLDASSAVSSATDALGAAGIAPELLYAGAGVVVLGVAAAVAFAMQSAGGEESSTSKVKRSQLPRKNCVIVFGATGRTGRLIVKSLLDAGRSVIAACRTAKGASEAWREIGVSDGAQQGSGAILFTETGVDVTKPQTLKKDVFAGATQVVVATGSARSREDGSNRDTPEQVDAQGVANVAEAAAQALPRASLYTDPVMQASDFDSWEKKNDQVMGGSSSSEVASSNGGATWSGNLVVEGGGFAGVGSPQMDLDLSEYDGLVLRCRGNGETFKLNVKTKQQAEQPTAAYQASFDTPRGDWVTVRLPWHEFVPVNMAAYDASAPPLDPADIASLGLLYSRFAVNDEPNPNHTPGAFKLEIDGGIQAFRAPRPAFLLLSSAGTERNARIGDDLALRDADIPIVQLNPGGVLNWKYKGEAAVRASGLPYCVLRATGIITDAQAADEPETYTIEFAQGDQIQGKLSRSDVATIVSAALQRPAATNTTFEARRTQRLAVGGAAVFDAAAQTREFLTLTEDRMRTSKGFAPFPAFAEPPGERSAEDRQRILSDPRVQAAQQRNKEVAAKSSAASSSSSSTGGAQPSGREQTAAPADGPTDDTIKQNKAIVQQWIKNWRDASPSSGAAAPKAASKKPEAKAKAAKAASQNGSKAAPASNGSVQAVDKEKQQEIEARKSSAQQWIQTWRSQSNGSGAPASNGTGGGGEGKEEEIKRRREDAQSWISKWREGATSKV